VTAALQATIWLSLICFAVGESGRTFTRARAKPPAWAWWIFSAGLLLAVIHTLIAFDTVHHWSHEDVISVTAAQTQAVFGVGVGGGVYVTYLFFVVWLADAWWWKAAPAGYTRPAVVTWMLRAFYMVIIFNAAVVFVNGIRRVFGLVIVSWLARLWSPGASHSGA
jgi:hypothetical protein